MCVHAHTCFKLHVHEGASTQAHAQRVKGRIAGIFLCHPPPYITETESICWTYCFAKCWDFGHLAFVRTHSVLPAHWGFEFRSWGWYGKNFDLHSLLSSPALSPFHVLFASHLFPLHGDWWLPLNCDAPGTGETSPLPFRAFISDYKKKKTIVPCRKMILRHTPSSNF